MHKLILITTCFILSQFSFAQSEKLEVEGAVIISNSDPSNPVAGTIRWSGQDFEGFNGSVWESLTYCPTDPTPIGNWGNAQSDNDYDENLPYSGIFVGAANPGFYGAANTSYARHQTIRFRAEKTGAINAVTIQNRILTGTTVHRRALLNSSAAQKYQACLDEFAARGNPILNQNNVTENKKANKCGYMIGGSYSAGNGGALIFQIRHDVNGEPDMANPPLAQTAIPHIPVDH